MLTLHNLAKNKSNRRSGKRRGRGNASGAGNYSGRGIKGQKARSGGRVGLKVKSIKSFMLRIPKVRGFKSFYSKMQAVNTGDLERLFKSGDTINFRTLVKAGLARDIKAGIKILAKGKLVKSLKIEANAFSKQALEQISRAGGEAVIINPPAVEPNGIQSENKTE
ncbi:MAG: 50S ribosomal protein L15 [Parcubacteria group bacterium]|nr:MAG: 50S ribosomal protein L15 [Parcubacteria group bacterium]